MLTHEKEEAVLVEKVLALFLAARSALHMESAEKQTPLLQKTYTPGWPGAPPGTASLTGRLPYRSERLAACYMAIFPFQPEAP